MSEEIDYVSPVVNSKKSMKEIESFHKKSVSKGLKKNEFNDITAKYASYMDGYSDTHPAKHMWVCLERGDKGPIGWYLSFAVYTDPMGDGEYFHLVNDKGLVRLFKNSDSAVNYLINHYLTSGFCSIGWC